jgi:trans-aconitate 2-methyltransferase
VVVTVDAWQPEQYRLFASEREQPFWDLRALLAPVANPTVVDLGCGDGRLTRRLATALGARRVHGIDSSRAMIEAARTGAPMESRVTFSVGDLATFDEPDAYDVLIANASLQWVGDHRGVLARWFSSLAPGGQLAVQVPANAHHLAHRLAAQLAAEVLDAPPPDVVATNVLAPEEYARILVDLGVGAPYVAQRVYVHHLASGDALVEWMKGTTLTRFREPLGVVGWERFVARYREALREEIGSGPYTLYFSRILMAGRRDAEWR